MANRATGTPSKLDSSSDVSTSVDTILVKKFDELLATGKYTKRSIVRISIAHLLETGHLKPGELLPSEQHLASLVDASLGTVQVALKQLVDRGYISRRRGDGTRVLSRNKFSDDIWHVRIVDPLTNHPLQVIDEKVWIDEIVEIGPWEASFELVMGDPMVRRTFTYQGGIEVAQELYLPKDKVQSIQQTGETEFEYTNIRGILFPAIDKIENVRRSSFLRVTELTIAISERHKIVAAGSYWELLATVTGSDSQPLYVQRIFAPTKLCGLAI